MPIYNAYDYLRPAMDSILDQTLHEIELICIDDGSTDHSLDILKEYQKKDERVRIITENNAGASTARNKGISRVRGEYMMFLDADDFYEPELLEVMYNRAKEDRLDIAVAKFDIYNNKQAKFTQSTEEAHADIFTHSRVASKNEYPDYILESTSGYVWNKMFSTEFIREKELAFAPELYVFEDVHFVASSLSLAERVGRVNEVMIHHRVYSEQQRAKLFRRYYNQVPVVYMKIKEFLMHHGMYIPLMRSFLNLSSGRCYKIYNLLWSDAKEKFWDMLHDGYADSLGWFKQEADAFESSDVAEFVASVGLYNHDQYCDLLKRGRKVDTNKLTLANLKRKIKNVKLRERWQKFWSGKKSKKKTDEQ